MIYLLFAQYMKCKMQVMRQRSACGLMTNSVKFMQQTTLSLSGGYNDVCSCNLLQSVYLINSLKAKSAAENEHP